MMHTKSEAFANACALAAALTRTRPVSADPRASRAETSCHLTSQPTAQRRVKAVAGSANGRAPSSNA